MSIVHGLLVLKRGALAIFGVLKSPHCDGRTPTFTPAIVRPLSTKLLNEGGKSPYDISWRCVVGALSATRNSYGDR
jgi:hypothetical protein